MRTGYTVWELKVIYFLPCLSPELLLAAELYFAELDCRGSFEFLKLFPLFLARACKNPGKEQMCSQSRPCQVALNPMVAGGRAMSEAKKVIPAQCHRMPCSPDLVQAHRGLTVKCLTSFRGKITSRNWRTQQNTNSLPSSETHSGSSKNQVIKSPMLMWNACYVPSANKHY